MVRKAKAAGFARVERLDWGERRRVADDLEVEVAPAQRVSGWNVNSYVLSAGGVRVFFGGEARDLEPLRRYRSQAPPVDIALLPIDGARFLGSKLVMDAGDALDAARILGARVLVPIHYALRSVPVLLQTRGSDVELRTLARTVPDLDVVCLTPGERWHDGERT